MPSSKKMRVTWSTIAMGAGVSCIIALIQGNGSLARGNVILLGILGTIFFFGGAVGLRWNKAPIPIGTIPRTIIVFLLSASIMSVACWYVWPDKNIGSPAAQQTQTQPTSTIDKTTTVPKTDPVNHPKEQEYTAAAPPSAETSTPPPRPYDLAGKRRTEFLKSLKPPKEADTLRIGCATWSEHACVAAGQFLILFSEAGWKIDGNHVFRLEPDVPLDGASIVSQPEPGPPLPPHLGRWHQMNTTEITLKLAFMKMGLSLNGANDPSLMRGTTGIYFGPEPTVLLKLDKRSLRYMQVLKFVSVGKDIQRRSTAAGETKAEPSEEKEWVAEVGAWLQTNLGQTDVLKFRQSNGIEAKWKYLVTIVQRLMPKQVYE